MTNDKIRLGIVDDCEADRFRYRKLLQREAPGQYDLKEWHSGPDFLAALEQGEELDCVVLDYDLGRVTGLDVLKTLTQSGRLETLAVVFLSGLEDPSLVEEAIGHGARDYLTKDQLNGKRLHWTLRNACIAQKTREQLRFNRDLLDQVSRRIQQQAQEESVRAELERRFLANLSHELRTPVAGMIGAAQHLADSPLNSEQSSLLSVLLSCGDSLLALIEDILTLSRLQARELQLTSESFELAELVDEAVETVQFSAEAKGLKVERSVPPELPRYFMLDPRRLRWVLLSLLSNAVKFSDKGRIELRVSGEPLDDNSWAMTFSVADQGVGIDQEQLPKLFQAFGQADDSFGRETSGAGLGLTISQRVVRQMGGEIEVSSAPGEGSVFRFKLSLPVSSPPTREEAKLQPLRGHKILLAEDNTMIAGIVQQQLNKLGQTVVWARDGLEAYRKFETDRFDLVLMDCQMPGLDGYEATRKIRSYESQFHAQSIPILALTAHALQGERERCLEAGMNDFMAKPVSLRQLHQKLLDWTCSSRSS